MESDDEDEEDTVNEAPSIIDEIEGESVRVTESESKLGQKV